MRALEGGGAAGGLAGGLAAIGARLEPGFDVVAGAAGLDDALDGADLVLTGEGKVDATSFAGKVVGGVLEWAADVGVPHRGVIAGQVTAEARDESSACLGAWVEALDRPRLAVGRGLHPRRAPSSRRPPSTSPAARPSS